jgi:hypothetical protein
LAGVNGVKSFCIAAACAVYCKTAACGVADPYARARVREHK